jgi:hypothetical protein
MEYYDVLVPYIWQSPNNMETLSPWFLETHSFHIEDPLRGLRHMIKAFSLKLLNQARERLA